MDGKASVFWKMHSSTTVESVLLEPRARRHGTRSHALPYGFRYVSSTGHEKANERKVRKKGKKVKEAEIKRTFSNWTGDFTVYSYQ